VKGAAAYLQAARVVAAGPVEEFDVSLVAWAPGRYRLLAIALDLARPQAGQPDLRRHGEEDDQVELRDERVSPSTERPRQHPGRGLAERAPEQLQPHLAWPLLAIGRIGREPEEIVGIQVPVAVPCRQQRGERGRPTPRGAEDVEAAWHPHGWRGPRHAAPPTAAARPSRS